MALRRMTRIRRCRSVCLYAVGTTPGSAVRGIAGKSSVNPDYGAVPGRGTIRDHMTTRAVTGSNGLMTACPFGRTNG